jgi:hypothetical protein
MTSVEMTLRLLLHRHARKAQIHYKSILLPNKKSGRARDRSDTESTIRQHTEIEVIAYWMA